MRIDDSGNVETAIDLLALELPTIIDQSERHAILTKFSEDSNLQIKTQVLQTNKISMENSHISSIIEKAISNKFIFCK